MRENNCTLSFTDLVNSCSTLHSGASLATKMAAGKDDELVRNLAETGEIPEIWGDVTSPETQPGRSRMKTLTNPSEIGRKTSVKWRR